jgi:RNA polymerase sigma-70 factor (ECF subfamily)
MSDQDELIDEQLLYRISKGDEKAFARLYQLTGSQLYNAIMIFVKDQEVAREIMQICYIKIWDHREELPKVIRINDYLFILARNVVFDHFKKVTIQLKLLSKMSEAVVTSSKSANHILEEKEFDHLVNQVIAQLPMQQRQAYILSMEDRLSYEEIAEQMQVSRFTVKRHLELARRYVRKCVRLYS